MGPQQLAGVLSIVARAVGRGARGSRTTRTATPALRAMVEQQIEAESLPHVPVRAALRRRRHRPARHPHGPRPVPVGRPHRARRGRARRLRRLPDVRNPFSDPFVCSSPTAARSPAASSAPAASSGIATVAVYSDADADAPHVREADTAVRLPGRRPRRHLPARRPAREGRARAPAPTPSTPATASSPRTPPSPRPSATPGCCGWAPRRKSRNFPVPGEFTLM